ncbi:MAG: hydroxymethylbilane synthase [Candidatus Omnitrophica bacterium]|nr:hydroxymethylbilane synthase [Candidatus Omnitrophota bacterium]MDD5512976.1 hydroxymethylbilane synthase [Candidatus Omnitrophota bacterium]
MQGSLRIGTRPSPLALKQVEEIQRIFASLHFSAIVIPTPGDRDKLTPLGGLEGSDFFTRDIDQALLAGEIDLGIHSSKDLPDPLAKGLGLVFETPSLSPHDALVSRWGLRLDELPVGWRMGTSSRRRKEQVGILRPDLKIIEIRGNIAERLDLIEAGVIDALIVAHAAMLRLGLESKVSQVLPLDRFLVHPRQGKLVLLAKEARCAEIRSILSAQARVTGS